MNYKEYEAKANQTPIYNPKVAIPYVVIGLAGEMGETFEKMKDEANIEDVALEIGDMMWYLAMIRIELNLPIEDDWNWNEDVRMPSPFDIVSEVGKIAEQVKKFLRDDWSEDSCNHFSENRKDQTVEAWKNVWSYLNGLSKSLGLTIEEIGLKNNEKLASRKKRNVIHGSGDLR